jgi:hypothetical protein
MSETTDQTAIRRWPYAGQMFEPGKSGNPGGRPKGIQHLARKHTTEAIAALVAALDNPKERVPAATVLLAYGWGRPVQQFDAEDQQNVTFLHLVAMRAFSDELNAQRVVDGDVVPRETTTDNTTQSQPRNLMEPATE